MNELGCDQLEPFVSDLIAVYRKYGVVISGCGCCSSPFLVELESFVKNERDWFDVERNKSRSDEEVLRIAITRQYEEHCEDAE